MKYWIDQLRNWYQGKGEPGKHPITYYRNKDVYEEAYAEIVEAHRASVKRLETANEILFKLEVGLELTDEEAKLMGLIKLSD